MAISKKDELSLNSINGKRAAEILNCQILLRFLRYLTIQGFLWRAELLLCPSDTNPFSSEFLSNPLALSPSFDPALFRSILSVNCCPSCCCCHCPSFHLLSSQRFSGGSNSHHFTLTDRFLGGLYNGTDGWKERERRR